MLLELAKLDCVSSKTQATRESDGTEASSHIRVPPQRHSNDVAACSADSTAYYKYKVNSVSVASIEQTPPSIWVVYCNLFQLSINKQKHIMPSTTTSVSSATAQTAHDVSRPDTQSVASANTQQSEQEKEQEREAERLYEERIEEEYAKREGGA